MEKIECKIPTPGLEDDVKIKVDVGAVYILMRMGLPSLRSHKRLVDCIDMCIIHKPTGCHHPLTEHYEHVFWNRNTKSGFFAQK